MAKDSKSKALTNAQKYGSVGRGRTAEQLSNYKRDKPKERVTIHHIKRESSADSPHFFTRSSMKFFGQRMKDYKVHKAGDRYKISAPMYDHSTGGRRYMGDTVRYFNPKNKKLERE